MEIIAEPHSHTVACSHAYSTLYENVQAAKQKGLRFLCSTEHGSAMPGAPEPLYFGNLKTLPDVIDGIIVLKGAEANILDYEGSLDVKPSHLEKLGWVIASYHDVTCPHASIADHTAGWIAVAKNPLVDVIGHCGDERFRFDYEAGVQAFAKYGKIVEINAHSFDCRPGASENCREIALLCKKYRVPVVCSSDAHFFTHIGETKAAEEMLCEIDFPEELILNANYDRFLSVAREKTGRQLV
ncbi:MULTISPECIES: phosphatase [Anaerotruncus]|uniref:phosphatase n=1 Tax=Anaerotruncus TaxID=244127 RepID=UPI00082988C0|nr:MULTISPECIES: phosphatase [Anaerotruncus]RGX56585.1 phosphatase [Anaerotruncus sp. AF02-27]